MSPESHAVSRRSIEAMPLTNVVRCRCGTPRVRSAKVNVQKRGDDRHQGGELEADHPHESRIDVIEPGVHVVETAIHLPSGIAHLDAKLPHVETDFRNGRAVVLASA